MSDDDLRTRFSAEPSVELRIVDNKIVCDWGVIDNPDGNWALPVGPLIVVTAGVVKALMSGGPSMDKYGHINSVRDVNGSLFFDAVTTDRTDRRWTWRLFPAHWWDGTHERDGLFIGRWMD